MEQTNKQKGPLRKFRGCNQENNRRSNPFLGKERAEEIE